MSRRSAVRTGSGAAIAVAASLVGVAAGVAHVAPNVCRAAGLSPGIVKRAHGIVREDALEQGTPVCEVVTRDGKVYVALYPEREQKAVIASWELDIHARTEPLAGLGSGAIFVYGAGHAEEAVGFTEGPHFVWLTSAAEYIRAELVALAAVAYAKLS